MAKNVNTKSLPNINATGDEITGTVYWYAEVADLDAPVTLAKMRKQTIGVSFRKHEKGETVFFQSDYMFLRLAREHMGMGAPSEDDNAAPDASDKSQDKGSKGGKGKDKGKP